MTHTEIKQCHNAGNSAWEILAMLINDGYDYSDAVYRVAEALRMRVDERAQMERDYDEIC